jgi:cation diffusion facilitator family transporter
MAAGGGTRAIIAAMLANGGIAIAKFVAFLVTSSSSMLAESIHSVADTSNQGLLLLGGRRARKDATDVHQFGYGRERYFWSFVVALILFSLGGLFAIYEGIEKIRHPHEVESIGWAIGVLLLGIVLEGFSFRTAVVESRPLKGDRSWSEFIRRARTPELPVVLLEDAGAMLGLVVALVGVTLAATTGNAVWDGVGTLVIGILLVIIALVLTVEMKSLLIGEAATRNDHQALLGALSRTDGVDRVIDLRSQHLGPDELLVAGKVQLARGLTFAELSDVVDAAEAAMREAVPAARRIYLEPDVYDPDHVETPDRPAAHDEH